MNELLVILAENSACVLLQMLIIVPLAAALLLFVIPDRFQLAKGLAALAVTLYLGTYPSASGQPRPRWCSRAT
ncbi:MAG: hypothetical protein R2758_06490 [Bacteroidales bacterium]